MVEVEPIAWKLSPLWAHKYETISFINGSLRVLGMFQGIVGVFLDLFAAGILGLHLTNIT